MKKETGEADTDYSLIFKNITAQVIVILTEATQVHNTRTNAATT